MGGWIPEGIGSERDRIRPRVRAARRTLGAAALAAAGRARRARPPWSAIGSWSPAARPTTSCSTPPRCSTASSGAPRRTSRPRASTSRRPRTASYVYAVGGRELSPDKNSAALERYDPATDRWRTAPRHADGPRRARGRDRGRPSVRRRRREPDARPGRGRVLRHRPQALVQRPVDAHPQARDRRGRGRQLPLCARRRAPTPATPAPRAPRRSSG